MLNDYFPIAILTFLALFVAVFVAGLGFLFGPKRKTKVKSQPYESGMVPYGPGKQRVSVRMILWRVVHLFDIELVFFLPWAVVFRGTWNGWCGQHVYLHRCIGGGIYLCLEKKGLEWE